MSAISLDQLAAFQAVLRVQRLVPRLFGVQVVLTAGDGNLYVSAYDPQFQPDYCQQMHNQLGGVERCVECDTRHFKQAMARRRTIRYSCHGGVRTFFVPILVDTDVIAFFIASGTLNAKPTEAVWTRIATVLTREKLDPGPLKDVFFRIRVMSPQREDELVELLKICADYVGGVYRQASQVGPPRHSQTITLAEEYVKAHFTEPISLDDVAAASHTTKRNLTRAFRRETDTTVLTFILSLRVARAADLLRITEMSCTEIAFQSGFSSIPQFNRAFKKFKGMPPSAWREL